MYNLPEKLIEEFDKLGIRLEDEHNFFGTYHALFKIKDSAYNFTILKESGKDLLSAFVWGYIENSAIDLNFKNESTPAHYENLTVEDVIELAKKGVEYTETIGKDNTWKKYEEAWWQKLKKKRQENEER